MLLIYIFAIVMIFSAVPPLVSMTKKASEGAAMRHAIERAGGKFIPTHTFWYMGAIDSEKCDFHVIFDNIVISVKVISLFSSNTIINFIDESSYEICVLNPKKKNDSRMFDFKKKNKKKYNFTYSLPEQYSKLPKASVLLMNTPNPLKTFQTKNGQRQEIFVSDRTCEGELYRTHSFIQLFK